MNYMNTLTNLLAPNPFEWGTKRLPGYSYKLQENRYAMDVAFSAGANDIDEKRMAIKIPFASGLRRDGVGDLLDISGIDTSRHRMNPIILFDHGKKYDLPVGLGEDPDTGAYTVHLDTDSKTAWVNAFFYQGNKSFTNRDQEYSHALFCEQLFDLMAKRVIRAGSIGYQVIKADPLQANYSTGTPQGMHLQKVLMLEASAVVLPANQDTTRKDLSRQILGMKSLCGRPLSPILVKSLSGYEIKGSGSLGPLTRKYHRLRKDTDKASDTEMRHYKENTEAHDAVHNDPVHQEIVASGHRGIAEDYRKGRTGESDDRLEMSSRRATAAGNAEGRASSRVDQRLSDGSKRKQKKKNKDLPLTGTKGQAPPLGSGSPPGYLKNEDDKEKRRRKGKSFNMPWRDNKRGQQNSGSFPRTKKSIGEIRQKYLGKSEGMDAASKPYSEGGMARTDEEFEDRKKRAEKLHMERPATLDNSLRNRDRVVEGGPRTNEGAVNRGVQRYRGHLLRMERNYDTGHNDDPHINHVRELRMAQRRNALADGKNCPLDTLDGQKPKRGTTGTVGTKGEKGHRDPVKGNDSAQDRRDKRNHQIEVGHALRSARNAANGHGINNDQNMDRKIPDNRVLRDYKSGSKSLSAVRSRYKNASGTMGTKADDLPNADVKGTGGLRQRGIRYRKTTDELGKAQQTRRKEVKEVLSDLPDDTDDYAKHDYVREPENAHRITVDEHDLQEISKKREHAGQRYAHAKKRSRKREGFTPTGRRHEEDRHTREMDKQHDKYWGHEKSLAEITSSQSKALSVMNDAIVKLLDSLPKENNNG